VTYTLGANIENLNLTGYGNINGTGNTGNNSITGNSGNNTLDGGTGTDTLIGGIGDDTYVVDSADDVITELANEGTDTVNASLTYTLGSNVENLTLTGSGNINGRFQNSSN
jgi:Ca2+-binding RTX toxin-like protein